jgi:hypothetical protein
MVEDSHHKPIMITGWCHNINFGVVNDLVFGRNHGQLELGNFTEP